MPDLDYYEFPIYVSGVAKSGTTLFLDLLDATPNTISYPDEPSFSKVLKRNYSSESLRVRDWVRCYSVIGVRKNLLLNKMFEEGFTDVANYGDFVREDMSRTDHEQTKLTIRGLENWHHWFDPDVYQRELEAHIRTNYSSRKDILTASIEAIRMAQRVEKKDLKCWVFKETFHGEKSVDTLFQLFPALKCLFIVRHPKSWYWSRKKSHAKEQEFIEVDSKNPFYTAKVIRRMKQEYAVFDKLRNKYGDDRIYITRYEDLVKNTKLEMNRILSFLELDYDPIALVPTKFGQPVNVPTAPQDRKGTVVFSDSLNGYKKHLSVFEDRLIDLLLFAFWRNNPFGYRRDYPEERATSAAGRYGKKS